MSLDFTPEEEDQMYREFAEADQRALRFRATASPQLASTVGQLYANNRDANPGVLLPAAQAVSSGRMTPEQAEKLLADTQRRELDAAKQEKKKKSWWERNVASKVRTASRWTMATLNFVPQTVTGAAAQLFDTNDNVDGWFISTDLGTLIANDEVAGDGYFLGGRAAQLQAERARRYRGEIDGKAWTIGRGFASVISQPGSREYNILSGLVDAVSAVAIPAVPGFQAAKAGVAAAGARAGEVAGVGLFTKSAAGLLDAERAAIDPKKVRAWIDSRGGAQAVQKVADVKTIDEAMQMFPKVQDAKFWLDVIDADDPGKARTLLLDNLGYGVDEFDLGDRNFVARIAGKSSRVAKLMASVPGQHVVLQGGNARDVAQSVKNVDNYLRLFSKGVGQPGISDEIRQGVVTRFARAITTNNGDVYSTMEEIDTITKLVLKSQGVPDEAITSLMAKTKEYRELSVYGALNEAGEATSFGAKVVLPDGRVMIAPTSTAGLQSEMMNQVTAVLPDPRRVRRMVGDLGWVMGKGKKLSNPENYRELRMPASALEFYQNELWRPLTLMTPGYVLRNMTDSAFRLSFTPGLKGGVYHPLQWIQMALHKRYRGTLTGEMFDDAEGVARAGMEEYARATGQGMREALDPLNLEHKGVKDRLWAAVNRQDKSRYRKGLQDEISLLHDDPVAQLVARGELSTDEIVKVLRTEDWGKKYVEQLQNRWRNKAMVDTATGQTDVVTADFLTNDTNLRAFVDEYIGKRVSHIARGNEVLRRAIADGKVVLDDGTEVSLFKTTRNGTRYDYTDEWTRAAERVIDDPNVELSPWLKTGIETKPGEIPTGGRQRSKVFAAFDKVTDKFFGELYPKRSAFLMQSPVFRQYYYQKVGNLLDELDATEVPLVREALEKAATKEGKELTDKWLAQYVGDSSLAKRLMKKLDAAPKEPEVSVAARPFAGDVPVINAPENAKVTKFEELDKPMYTGQPISFTLYRGYGSPKEVKGTGSNAILGRALYATPDFDYAAQFAGREIKETVFNPQNGKINIEYTEIPGTVAKIQVELKNPMVIVSEPSGVGTVYWNDLVKEAGWEFAGDPRQAGRDPLENIARLRELIESKGHDGVIIRIWKDKFGYRQSALRDVAAGDQVVVFPKATPNVPEKAAVSTGLSLSELDAYAKGFALDSTKELFYNAAEKSNFADILRVVVPFGSAWSEVISSWTKIAASNPEALKRLGVSVEGLRDADPDNDGRGFFWKDPQTGEYVFNYPFSKQLGPLTSYFGGIGALGGAAVFGAPGALAGGAAGLAAGGVAQSMFGVPGVELQAPARTLNMGLNIVPGLGPMAQIAASRILGKLPAADDVRRFLTPYGEPELTVIPSWMQKVQDVIQSPESNRMLGDMKIETMRVLAMTGEYDLSNEADKQRLEDDADSRARTLLMLRALGQFVGPTRPSVEFKVETYAGDVYGSELSKAFRDFQASNYDTAVETFMQVFGDDAFLYMAGKTRSAVGGLDASKEFGNFERDNRSLFARYKDVAGYFAPTGSNFDYQVYLRQLATGQREKLKPSELVAEAQALVGRSIYRNVVRMAGPYPTTEQRDYLRMVRQDLQQRFPGYAYQPMVFNRLESQITQILAAVGDDILDGNPVAEATRIYMDARDQALQEAVKRGFTSLGGKNVADLRAWLRNVADGIIVSYPQFERIYDRVLFNEIDLDAGE